MGFLSEAITASDPVVTSAFTECIILATISGRALLHRHQSVAETMYDNATDAFWHRHQWINALLHQRIEVLSLKYPSTSQHANPMLLFTGMAAQMTVLHLYTTMKSTVHATDNRGVMAECERCAWIAVTEIVNLTKILTQFSAFRVSLVQFDKFSCSAI